MTRRRLPRSYKVKLQRVGLRTRCWSFAPAFPEPRASMASRESWARLMAPWLLVDKRHRADRASPPDARRSGSRDQSLWILSSFFPSPSLPFGRSLSTGKGQEGQFAVNGSAVCDSPSPGATPHNESKGTTATHCNPPQPTAAKGKRLADARVVISIAGENSPQVFLARDSPATGPSRFPGSAPVASAVREMVSGVALQWRGGAAKATKAWQGEESKLRERESQGNFTLCGPSFRPSRKQRR